MGDDAATRPYIDLGEVPDTDATPSDSFTLGRRLRHFRGRAGLTLAQLAEATGTTAAQLSHIENGRREPRLSLLQAIARTLGVPAAALIADEPPPDRRAQLEIALEHAQRSPLYRELGAPVVRPGRTVPLPVLESLTALHGELARRAREAVATPEEARRATTELRLHTQRIDNHVPELEELAETAIRRAGYSGGAVTHRTVARMAESLGFAIIHTPDLPHSTRTVTDLANGRIYLPPASIPGGHGLRSLALQAMAHRLLGHGRPTSYAEFLRQRLEITYFAAAALVPRGAAVPFLEDAKARKDLAIEDFRDAFGITHQFAAQRFINLATSQLGIPIHFVWAADDGTLIRGWENDGIALPEDATGSIEGQVVCRYWAARQVFGQRDRTTEYHQYTDTPTGTYLEATQTGSGAGPGSEFSITVGVPFNQAKWFRGRETTVRTQSRCPDASCCRRPPSELAQRWADQAWPSAQVHAQVLRPLPSGSFPGVDDAEVYAFLERHAPR
ncbi:XRE family transcriptional regulator [Serinibacter arcticus]|uniref:XRE family transcriptional regulator n=1 Tax=Serinibacter arcticus TaxID=1655435 RepID=A0A2U1ZXJ2_9MICO|nr:XRE family transcriptional regulator [Serinibacter arcticus]PWD51708.1 XRE family transcriptional regulator [Serinibacter arcticus]